MDPITAWKIQQERLGFREKTTEELRQSNALWAVAFDAFDEENQGMLTCEQALAAFGRIAEGPGSKSEAAVPAHKLRELFKEIAEGGCERLDFRRFHKLTIKVTEYMVENPKWRVKEAEMEKKAKEKKAKEVERRVSGAEPVDVYGLLGIKVTKDLQEMQAAKEQALARKAERTSAEKFRDAGIAVIGAQKVVRRARVALAAKRHSTVQDDHDHGDDETQNGRLPEVSRVPRKTHTIDLPTDLPELMHRGFGTACVTMAFSNDGVKLAGGFFDGCVRIYDVDRRSQLHTLSLSMPGTAVRTPSPNDEGMSMGRRLSNGATGDAPVTCVRWMLSQRHNVLAMTDTSGAVGLWNVPFGRAPELMLKRAVSEQELDCLAFTTDGTRMYTGGAEKVIKLFDIERASSHTLRDVDSFGDKWSGLGKSASAHHLKILSLAVDPTSRDVFLSGGMDKMIFMWDSRVGSSPVASLAGTELAGDAMDISRNGMTVLAGSHRISSPIQIFDLRNTKEALAEMPVITASPEVSPRPPPAPAPAQDDRPQRAGSKESVGSGSGMKRHIERLSPVASYEWGGQLVDAAAPPRPHVGSMLFSAKWDAFSSSTIAVAGEKENLGQILQRPKNQATDEPLKVRAVVEGRHGVLFTAAVSEDARTAAFGSSEGSVEIVDLRQV